MTIDYDFIDYNSTQSNFAQVYFAQDYFKPNLVNNFYIALDDNLNENEKESLILDKIQSTTQEAAQETIISGENLCEIDKEFNPKVIWGPIKARLIPDTKHTLAKIAYENISNLSREEYERMRQLMEYIITHPESKARVFELTGFNDNDLEFAQPYLQKYSIKKFFAKLVDIALITSSNGKVSKQFAGLIQFIFEIKEINSELISDEFKYSFLRGLPNLVGGIWEQLKFDCQQESGICAGEYKEYLDMNDDLIVDMKDYEIAQTSLIWLQIRNII